MPRSPSRLSLLIRGALLEGTPSSIHIRHGRIASIAPEVDAGGAPLRPTATPPAAGRVIDGRGLHAFPSFRNAHTHVAMVLLRGYGDDMPLMEWLTRRIWPAEKRMSEEDVYHGARLGTLEMIRGGTTFFNEMYWHRPAIVRAVEEMGIRALVGVTVIDVGDPALLERQKEEVRELVAARRAERAAGSVSGAEWSPSKGLAELAIAPHAIYTVSSEVLRWLGEVARAEGLLLHIHLSETAKEVEDCLAAHGCRPTQLLDRLGLVGPNLVAAHGQFLDDAELELLGAAGATVVTNPAANLKLATGGIFPYRRARRAGVRVCLGTDGAASNNRLDMIEAMKLAALLQKHHDRDATALPAGEALAMATTAPAEAFELGSGRIEPGAPADLVLMDFSGPATQPVHDPVSTLVYAASAANVHTTICHGGRPRRGVRRAGGGGTSRGGGTSTGERRHDLRGGPLQSTITLNIMPASSCSRLWQWSRKRPRWAVKRTATSHRLVRVDQHGVLEAPLPRA
jgi:5-methylthioadenosine/S-adenosylhomocysteine deaminase